MNNWEADRSGYILQSNMRACPSSVPTSKMRLMIKCNRYARGDKKEGEVLDKGCVYSLCPLFCH